MANQVAAVKAVLGLLGVATMAKGSRRRCHKVRLNIYDLDNMMAGGAQKIKKDTVVSF